MLTKKKLDHYFSLTEKTLKNLKIKKPKNKTLQKASKDFLNLAKCYYKDAKYFYNKKDYVNAFAAINYAHAFLDAGAILGIFHIEDPKLLMVDKT
jgi:hypothetical protein